MPNRLTPWPLRDLMRYHTAREEIFHCEVLLMLVLDQWEATPWDVGMLTQLITRQRVAQDALNAIGCTER